MPGTRVRGVSSARHVYPHAQVVLLDEAHERTVNTDVLLGLLKGVLARRPDDFRLIVMSATLDAAPMSSYFGDARIAYVKVTGLFAGVSNSSLAQADQQLNSGHAR